MQVAMHIVDKQILAVGLGIPVQYWASHSIDAKRRSLFFSLLLAFGITVVAGCVGKLQAV